MLLADVWQELLELMRLAAPACVQLIAQQGMIITNQVFAGHLGTTQLAAASIGMTVRSMTLCTHWLMQHAVTQKCNGRMLAGNLLPLLVCSGSTFCGTSCWATPPAWIPWPRKHSALAIDLLSWAGVFRQ